MPRLHPVTRARVERLERLAHDILTRLDPQATVQTTGRTVTIRATTRPAAHAIGYTFRRAEQMYGDPRHPRWRIRRRGLTTTLTAEGI